MQSPITNCWTDWGPKCAVISCKHLIKGLRNTLEQGSTCCKMFEIVLHIKTFRDLRTFWKVLSRIQRKGSLCVCSVWGMRVSSFPALDLRQFSFILSWTKDGFISWFRPNLDKRQLRFVQSWTKDSFLPSCCGQKFLEPTTFVFVCGQSFWSRARKSDFWKSISKAAAQGALSRLYPPFAK